VLEVPEESSDGAMGLIQYYMENPFGDGIHLRVPLPVDIKKVSNWAEAK
jgi:DNA polymerase I-like protein with 3'-5' exonuclease and polymerase domains